MLGPDRVSGTGSRDGGRRRRGTRAASVPASASVGNAVRDDPTRARTGPATPEDAWKWEGVPAGRSLIGKVEPGEMRYYMDDDGHGPQIRWLPAAWPPGQGPPGQGPPGQGPPDQGPDRERRARVALPVRTPRARRWVGGLASRPDRHRGRGSRLRCPGAALGAQCGGGGGGHRRPRPLRRAGDGAGGRPDRRRVVARRRVLGHPPGRGAGRRAPRCAARAAPAARRLAGHGRGARPRRADAHGGPLAARPQLRLAGGGRAGSPGRRLGLRAVLVGPRGLAGAPGAVGGGVLPRRRPRGAVVPRRRGGARRGIGLHRLL